MTVQVLDEEHGNRFFTQFRRTAIIEFRRYEPGENMLGIRISAADQASGCPKNGDMIARDPSNHKNKWLVSAEDFTSCYEEA